MAEKKHRRVPRLAVVCGVVAVLLVVLAIAANVGTDMFRSTLDHYLGGRDSHVEKAPGSENWDTAYYNQEYRGRGRATDEAKKLVTEIESEGAVLLKNDGVLPLAKGTSVSLLGRYAADPVYGGAGSGTVDPNDCTDLRAGLAGAGLQINDVAYNWTAENAANYPKANITMDNPSTASYYIGEIPLSDYPQDVRDSIAGTTAIVVVGRGGGEGGDLSRDLAADVASGVSSNFVANAETANYAPGQHELELTREERDLIAEAKAKCDHVIVLVNASTSMELGDLVEGDLAVDAIMHIGSLGASGSIGVGQLLTGEVNPSGRTTDIWAADFTADPTFNNFGGHRYTDVEGYYPKNNNNAPSDGTAYFVEYKEGVYMGYRYYETAHVEAEAGNYAGFDYKKAVVFPFGYGLSYTNFSETLDSVTSEGDKVTAQVTVTNTGSVAGKQVVELYFGAPYTVGGPEKPAVVLGAFDKTRLLAPGESQTLTLSMDQVHMASWDSKANGGKGAYVLAGGSYDISLRTDSHTVVSSQKLDLTERTWTTDPVTGADLENRFADLTEYMDRNYKPFSRSDFAGTFPTPAADRTAAESGVTFEEYDYTKHLNDQDKMPTTGANNGLSLIDMRGLDYDDPKWDKLLDQMSVSEMTAMLGDCAYNTAEAASISKPATKEPDGPAGFTSLKGPTGNCAYCSEVIMAQTWNTELMYRMGQMIGQEALASGYNGWYAPAVNTHRSPFAGRNFEYYSEDPLLAGKTASAVVSGAASNGCYAMVKHFALNDQESYRVQHLATWANEQTVREIYLRAFEIPVKEARYEMRYLSDDKGTVATREMPACTGIMSSFNYIGTEWAGGRKTLCTDVLRNEWGFKGCVITDFNLYGYMDENAALFGGTDMQLTIAAMKPGFQGTDKPSVVAGLRNASHHLLYTVANSNVMQGMAPGSRVVYGVAPWQWGVWGGSAVAVLLAAGLGFIAYRKIKRAQEKDAA